MRKQTQSYFTFSKKELDGILVLLVLITLILSFPFVCRLLYKPETYDLESYRKEIAEFKASAVSTRGDRGLLRDKIEERERKPDYFMFDPNTLQQSGWLRLGLSPKQARVIHNYISKGGKFYKPEDLRKIYSVTEDQYTGLKAYVRIVPAPTDHPAYRKAGRQQTWTTKTSELVMVELNAADSTEMERIRGIGPAFASRIIRFRNRLGGFHSIEQLREVYGMDSVRFAQLSGQVSVDLSLVVKKNINTATFEQLRLHPYLSYKQINAIIQYRRQHGNYTSVSDLKKVLILNEEIIRKIEPYLAFDQ